MTKNQFKDKLESRLQKRLLTQSFCEMTVCGSKMRFDMALAIAGAPFGIPHGEDEKDYNPLLTDAQYQSGKYDGVIDEVFSNALENAGCCAHREVRH